MANADVRMPANGGEEFILIGPRKVEIWSQNQEIASIDRSIKLARFGDTEVYHAALVARILEEEARLRRDAPTDTRCMGGQKVRGLLDWDLPEFKLLNERAKAFFRQILGSHEAVVDACWANVYRQWDSIGPHCHRRATASLVYCLEAGDDDEDCRLSGRFSIVDPRLDLCCWLEKGHMTNPFYPDLSTGAMLIFPGKILHCVSAYAGRRPRITLSWNINRQSLPGSVRDPIQLNRGGVSVTAGAASNGGS